MKRYISVILIISICCMCSVYGCASGAVSTQGEAGGSSVNYNFLSDCQLVKSGSDSSSINVAKGEEGYYVAIGKYIYYVDGNTMSSIILCSKPNCLHNNEQCNAFIGANDGIMFNQGYLYTFIDADIDNDFVGRELIRISVDGTLKETCFYTEYMPVDWMIHRGYLFYSVKKYTDADYTQSTNCDAYLYRLSLNSANAKPEEVYYAQEVEQNANIGELVAFDSSLFFWISGNSREDKANEISKTICMNINTCETKEMLSPKGEELFSPKLLGSNLVFGGGVTAEGYQYYKTDINGDCVEPFIEIKKDEQIICDGKYLYVDNALGLSVEIAKGEISEEDAVRKFKVYDESLKLVDELYFSQNKAYTWNFLPIDDKVFLFGGKNADDRVIIFYYDKGELGTLKGREWNLRYALDTEQREHIINNSIGAISNIEPQGSDMLISLWRKAKEKGYGVNNTFETEGAEVEGGFSIRLVWDENGGSVTSYFPFLEFVSENECEKFSKEYPFSLRSGKILVLIGVQIIPKEVYDMINSVLKGEPIEPIDSSSFSGETFSLD